MIEEICAEIKNYFTYEIDKHFGTFRIEDQHIVPSIDLPTDYIRIWGSRKNDGVHKVSDNDLIDEGNFNGAVWIMSPPKAFLDLVKEITAWQEANGAADSPAMSPYSSESFGGYSYQKGYNTSQDGTSWAQAYSARLNPYRRIRL